MKSLLAVVCLYVVFSIKICKSYPYNGVPVRTIMFGGYYGGHGLSEADAKRYTPQGLSFSAGDTIATNTYVGEQYPQVYEATKKTEEKDSDLSKEIEEIPLRKTPRRKPPPPKKDEDIDADALSTSWPLQSGSQGVPSYNAFFPIVFGGSSGGAKSRSGGDDSGYYPGAATAIANSFSTGKGGVATSHATSFGDPYLSSMLRSYNNRKMKSSPSPQEIQENY